VVHHTRYVSACPPAWGLRQQGLDEGGADPQQGRGRLRFSRVAPFLVQVDVDPGEARARSSRPDVD